MSDKDQSHPRLSHKPILSSDELILLLEENVEDYALIVTDPDSQIINWSRGAEKVFGYAAGEVLGKDARLIFTPEDKSLYVPEQEFQTALANGRASDERWHIRKDATRFWASGSLTALRDAEGNLRGTVKILRDTTERKRLEDALRAETEAARLERNRAERERERAERSMSEIAHLNELLRRAMAEAHHRIKNSFQMLSALIEMQREIQENDAVLDFVKLSLHVRSLSAIHDLLTQDAKTSVEFNTVSAKDLFEKLIRLMQKTIQGRTINAEVQEITLSLQQATSLAPLISEMVVNSVKHGEGEISVALTRSDNNIRLEVKDQGPGFAEDFDLKRSAHTGVELIEMLVSHDLRGQVRFENRAEGGARITATFPAYADYT
jgi:PAS domain S-box-containing protein